MKFSAEFFVGKVFKYVLRFLNVSNSAENFREWSFPLNFLVGKVFKYVLRFLTFTTGKNLTSYAADAFLNPNFQYLILILF